MEVVMNSICKDNDNFTDIVATLLVKLYANYALSNGQDDDYAMAVGIAIRMLTD